MQDAIKEISDYISDYLDRINEAARRLEYHHNDSNREFEITIKFVPTSTSVLSEQQLLNGEMHYDIYIKEKSNDVIYGKHINKETKFFNLIK